jgi:mevalonate pyrophosphate decarboxylase
MTYKELDIILVSNKSKARHACNVTFKKENDGICINGQLHREMRQIQKAVPYFKHVGVFEWGVYA